MLFVHQPPHQNVGGWPLARMSVGPPTRMSVGWGPSPECQWGGVAPRHQNVGGGLARMPVRVAHNKKARTGGLFLLLLLLSSKIEFSYPEFAQIHYFFDAVGVTVIILHVVDRRKLWLIRT